MTTYNDFIGQNASRYWDETTKNYPQIMQHLKAFGDFRGNGERQLNDFQPFDMVYFSDYLLEGGRSNSTVNRYLSSIGKIFTKAHRMRITKYPMTYEKLREPKGRNRVYTNQQISAIVSYLNDIRPWMADYCIIGVNTGMRRGEIAGITREVYTDGAHSLVLAKTKNGDKRQVPLNAPAREALSRLLSGNRNYYNGFQDSTWKRTWKRLKAEMVRMGVFAEDDDFVFHSMRHTCASNLVNKLMVPTVKVAKILGQRRLETTMKYVHEGNEDSSIVLMEQLASKIGFDRASVVINSVYGIK
ncbi:MAG: hypothetical protein CMI60_14195 [Parvibaculum sp.]|nr:hypothetical protein [Parvibaculum sp.]